MTAMPLPALAEEDLQTFGAAIRELQERTGDHFAPAQGGRYASPAVTKVLTWMAAQGVACYGQSSWGPTGFAVVQDAVAAQDLMTRLEQRFSDEPALSFMLCKGRNEGGMVQDI